MRVSSVTRRGVKIPTLAAALAILLAGGCAEESGNLLAGAWELNHFYCEDEKYGLPANVRITLEYGDPDDGYSGNAFRATFRNTTSGCTIVVSGTYKRSGLTVKETVNRQTCTGLPCTIPAIPPSTTMSVCSSASETFDDETHTFVANLGLGGDPEIMAQYDHSPLQFCGSGTFFEQQVFTKSP